MGGVPQIVAHARRSDQVADGHVDPGQLGQQGREDQSHNGVETELEDDENSATSQRTFESFPRIQAGSAPGGDLQRPGVGGPPRSCGL